MAAVKLKPSASTAEIRRALDSNPMNNQVGSVWRTLSEHFKAILDLLDEIRCTEHDECRADPEMGIKCATDTIRRKKRLAKIARVTEHTPKYVVERGDPMCMCCCRSCGGDEHCGGGRTEGLGDCMRERTGAEE